MYQYTKEGGRKGNIPKEDEKSKDDVVFPRLKETDYLRGGCIGTR
jgi:hypothetical protein